MILKLKMSNGATVGDWLGTALIAAAQAKLRIERGRGVVEIGGGAAELDSYLETAAELLEQARDEVVQIRHRLEGHEAVKAL